MKTTDLIVGDFFSLYGNKYKIESIKKCGAIRLEYYPEGERVQLTSDFILEDLKPIPLTSEILEKNFRPGSKSYNSFDPDYIIPGMPDSFGLELRNGVLYITDHVLMPIRYVHELQHALRMCGLDKLADNFKI